MGTKTNRQTASVVESPQGESAEQIPALTAPAAEPPQGEQAEQIPTLTLRADTATHRAWLWRLWHETHNPILAPVVRQFELYEEAHREAH